MKSPFLLIFADYSILIAHFQKKRNFKKKFRLKFCHVGCHKNVGPVGSSVLTAEHKEAVRQKKTNKDECFVAGVF